MKRFLLAAALLTSAIFTNAQTMEITRIKHAGPFPVQQPFQVNDVDVNSKAYNAEASLDKALSFKLLDKAGYREISEIEYLGGKSIYLAGFDFTNSRYTKAAIKVEGVKSFHIYLDGTKLTDGKATLEPATHSVVIKYFAEEESEEPQIKIECDKPELITLREDNLKSYTIKEVIHGSRFNSISLSPDGKYLIIGYSTTLPGGESTRSSKITEVSSGRVVANTPKGIRWMPTSNKYYYTAKGIEGRELITVDPATGKEEIIATNIPDGYFEISPTEDFLIYTMTQEGPAEKKEIYEVIEPDDRQPGWRNRSYLAKYDLKSGYMQQLTFGYNNTWSTDISADGKELLVMTSCSRLTERPTTLRNLYKLNLATLQAEIIIENDGFISGALFSPDASKVLVTGSPEALGGIGLNVKEGQIPNMYDNQLYIIDLQSKTTTAATKEFNPSVQSAVWSKFNNKIYFTAENRDLISLYTLDPQTMGISQEEAAEELVNNITIASTAPVMAYYGQGASNSDKAYIVDLKRGKSLLFEDLSAGILKDIELGECIGWEFTNSKGDTINGRYYLPPHFDKNKKYPLIVNYYGGCSPTSRNFESRYPHHAYAALGYIVYVINPSGATGFGQEFSARHVNTAGEGPAEDIIEGTKEFCKSHPFVDEKKIGCIGASYGGFMTQYLQTRTDIFAAAISHAGISDHTSYWGEGYWGYSYSEVSMAKSYPWSHKDLYVNQSPLFNAEKINTPILFLHGDADVNVPVGESIQMYTALKLLGKETAMVLVKDQDHHILDYNKRLMWQNTIFAWFAKWLQDDPTWWEAIYSKKSL